MTRCCSPLLENTDVRYCPATFATLTCCSSLIPRGKSCSIRPALCEHPCERLIFQEQPLYLLQRFPAVALLGPRQCAHCRGSVRRTAARVLLSGATKLLDESFNITVAMVLAVLYELYYILTSQTSARTGTMSKQRTTPKKPRRGKTADKPPAPRWQLQT